MSRDGWFDGVTADAMRGRSLQVTLWTQRDAKRCMCEYVMHVRHVGVDGWSATWNVGNQKVTFASGGCIWFESFRHAPRPGATRVFPPAEVMA